MCTRTFKAPKPPKWHSFPDRHRCKRRSLSTSPTPPGPRSVPELLRVHAEDGVGERVRVREHVRGGVRALGLEAVEDLEELVLDEVDEDEVDGVRVGDARR